VAPVKGLALSGGGARGSFQVGALEYLYKVENYRPDVISSTSVGSINALAIAQGATPAAQLAQLNILLGIWRGLSSPTQFYTLRQWARICSRATASIWAPCRSTWGTRWSKSSFTI
jgi:predicted acylesterase/phospholipase RssA